MRLTFRLQLQLALMGMVAVTGAAAVWALTSRIDSATRREQNLQTAAQLSAVTTLYQERSATLVAESEAISLYPAVVTAVDAGNAAPLSSWASALAEHQDTHVTVLNAGGVVIARSHDPGHVGDSLATSLPGVQLALNGQQVSGSESGDELGLALRGYAPVLQEGHVVGVVMLADPFDDTLLVRLAAGGPPPHLENAATGSGCSTAQGQQAQCRLQLRTADGRPSATLSVTVPLTEIQRARSDALQRVIVVGLPLALLGMLIAWLLGRTLSRPLALLSQRAAEVTGVTPGPPFLLSGPPEVRALATALEGLRQRVEAAVSALQRDRAVLQAVLEATEDGIVLLDATGRVVAGNARWSALTAEQDGPDGSIHQHEGTSTLAAIGDELVAAPGRSAVLALERNLPYQRFRLFSTPAPLPDGASSGRVMVLHDTTEELAAERLRSALVATVSHELRSPLTAITGYAHSLLDAGPWDAETEREFLQIILDAAGRLAALIDDLLDAARLESGTLRLEREPVQLEHLVRPLLETRKALSPNHRLALELEGPLPLVEGDPRRLEQLLSNLVDNAIKYSPEGGRIVVSLRAGKRVTVAVSDEGIGIAPADLPHLFERFYRASDARTRGINGTGLGLFICRSLVAAHGGELRVSSRLGAGSTFTFDLPALDELGPDVSDRQRDMEQVR